MKNILNSGSMALGLGRVHKLETSVAMMDRRRFMQSAVALGLTGLVVPSRLTAQNPLNRNNIVALRCLGQIDGPRYLNGQTRDGSVGLAPSTAPPYSGTHWLVVGIEGVSAIGLRCLGDVEGPRFLNGVTREGAIDLAPNAKPPYTGTRWEIVELGDAVGLRCMGQIEGPRYLNGVTREGAVDLAPNTKPPYTGTHWAIEVIGAN